MEHGAAETYDQLAELLELFAAAEPRGVGTLCPAVVESSDS